MSEARWAALVEEILAAIERGVLLNQTHRAPTISLALITRWRAEKEAALAPKVEP